MVASAHQNWVGSFWSALPLVMLQGYTWTRRLNSWK